MIEGRRLRYINRAEDFVSDNPPRIGNTCSLNGDSQMSRHLNNLKSLGTKLESRYGDSDPVVLEVKREIEAIEARDSRPFTPYRDFIRAQSHGRIEPRMSGLLAA